MPLINNITIACHDESSHLVLGGAKVGGASVRWHACSSTYRLTSPRQHLQMMARSLGCLERAVDSMRKLLCKNVVFDFATAKDAHRRTEQHNLGCDFKLTT